MFINFWYAVERADKVSNVPIKKRMLGLDFVVFSGHSGGGPLPRKHLLPPGRVAGCRQDQRRLRAVPLSWLGIRRRRHLPQDPVHGSGCEDPRAGPG